MTFDFKLPDIGEGVHEGEVVSWLVHEGDQVAEDQPIVEVMTDKATVEITSPRAGSIAKLHFGEGDVVQVGEILVSIEEAGGSAKPAAKTEAPAAKEAEPKEEMTLFEAPPDSERKRRRPKPRRAPSPSTMPAPQAPDRSATGGKVLATPATRKLARDLGVDLTLVPGTGEKGRVLKDDVQAFAKGGAAPAPARAPAPAIPQRPDEERVPVRGLRKAIFENMRRSKDTAVHFTYWDEVDVTELVKLRKDAKAIAEAQGVKLTYLPFLVKASVAALKEYPDINANMDEAAMELVRRGVYNIGIATATDRGLMVVVVKDADRKSIFQIAAEIESLAAKANAGKATREDLTGGTFTITSLGRDGGRGATPVINHPEVAIMGVHSIWTAPRYDEDMNLRPRQVMNLAWSFDHRLIDGHVGAAFAQRIKQLLETPTLLLLGTQ